MGFSFNLIRKRLRYGVIQLSMQITFWILVVLTFGFTYVNGFHDGCNVVATLIASRSMKPYPALAWAAIVEVLSPFAVLAIGSSVSNTIKKLVAESCYSNPAATSIALAFISAGILAAIIWNLTTWLYAIPASSSHALIGGVIGAGIAAYGTNAIAWNYFWTKIVLMIFLTPFASFLVGFCILHLLRFITKNASLRAQTFFQYAQWINMTFLAFNHSFNDSQKSIGIIMILIGIYGGSIGTIPIWVIAGAATSLACGIAFGGFKIIKTVGTGIYKVQAIDSFASQMTAGSVLLISSMLGAPVSSSQIVSSSIMGVGTAERYKAVKWNIAGKILLSWFITIPIAAMIGAGLFLLFRLLL